MQYIISRGLTHRDLAARNILLCENHLVKISDFGLCCNAGENLNYQLTIPKRLPMKWLPPEALTQRIFSEKSDVWSFGILMYEMYSLGKEPYGNMESREVLTFLNEGKRLERPEFMQEEKLEQMMKNCWEEDPVERPSFGMLSGTFRTVLEESNEDTGYLM